MELWSLGMGICKLATELFRVIGEDLTTEAQRATENNAYQRPYVQGDRNSVVLCASVVNAFSLDFRGS